MFPLRHVLQWGKFPAPHGRKGFSVAMEMQCGHIINRKFSRAPKLRARCELCPPIPRQMKLEGIK
jgi:hypothetical protein